MILVDTSAWVEFDRATGSPVDRSLTALIGHGDEAAVCEPVVAEVLAGARSEQREQDLRRLLARFPLLPCDAAVDFESAASIYLRCRRRGVTPRGLLDCLIAAVAIRHDVAVLAADADMTRIADVVALRLVRPDA